LFVFTAPFAAPLAAQAGGDMKPDAKPLPSPAATAETLLGSGRVTITYNSPAMRGRAIMGGVVPYGQVWRTGANPATTIVATTDLMIGPLAVPAGTYTLYTLPGKSDWLLIVNQQTGQWGTEYSQAKDLGRVPMKATPMTSPQEHMTITFEHTSGSSTQLHVRWETTDRYVTITAK
jgi:hypothetical protein